MSELRVVVLALVTASASWAGQPGSRYFEIRVVDSVTGRGVPLVELRTVHQVRYVTDSNGIVAFHEPGLMGRRVFFHVKSHGYEFPKDGFGNRGKALMATAGGQATLKLKRLNIAERLCRVTGAGIYRDSVLVGHAVPIREPVLNGLVLGSDSVVNALFRHQLYWFWGDTNRPGYPLGNFHVPGATSVPPRDGGLDPETGVNLRYFVDERGFARQTCRMPGKGPTWITGLVVVPDGEGRERMFAAYAKVRGFLEIYERGLVEFDHAANQFTKVLTFDKDAPARPHGHPTTGDGWVYFGDPFPLVRARATAEALQRVADYEAFTCLTQGGRLDRRPDGTLRYGWKRGAPPLGPQEQARRVKSGEIKREETLVQLQDVETGKPVVAHRGSVYPRARGGPYVMIATEVGGTSHLGEVWYAEADARLGPWVYARKIVTHERYSFYNPKQHPYFDKDAGRTIFFEGTYTATFSGNADKTPRYDYNQILYKLDLTDPRLALPVAVYQLRDKDGPTWLSTRQGPASLGGKRRIVFFALARRLPGTVAVYASRAKREPCRLTVRPAPRVGRPSSPIPFCHVLPVETKDPPPTTMPLYEFVHPGNGSRLYSTSERPPAVGYVRTEKPVCRVWRNPFGEALSARTW